MASIVDESDKEDAVEGLLPLVLDTGCAGTSEATARTLCETLWQVSKGKSAAAPAPKPAAAETLLAAPIRLASKVLIEEEAIAKDVRKTMVVSVNYNSSMQGHLVTINDGEDDMGLKARLKREKRLLKLEKSTVKRERTAAQVRSEILERITNTPMVIHNAKGDDVGGRDIVMKGASMNLSGLDLLVDLDLTLVHGRHYGLIGRNGIGKTTFLKFIAAHEFQGIPKHLQILHIEQEVEGDDDSVLQSVLCCDVEREALLEEEKELIALGDNVPADRPRDLNAIYTRLEEIDAASAPARAAKILAGLGFDSEMQQRPTKSFSGGWRMRVALARALFIAPDVLLLDEPTNHLDLHAVLWLEDYLNSWPNTLIIVSHAREFLNNVVTDILHFQNKTIVRYKGDYNNFEEQRVELQRQQNRSAEAMEKQKAHIQAFVDRFRYNAKRAAMVQSRIKLLSRMGSVSMVADDPEFRFQFPNPEPLAAPVIQVVDVSFGYDPAKLLFQKLNLAVDLQSRIALVGPNGIGKSTLLNLIVGDLEPTHGSIIRNGKLRLGRFSQHFVDQLNLNQTPLEMMKTLHPDKQLQVLRNHLGSMGVSGKLALQPIYSLSGGQKARVAIARLAFQNPHIMLLDEPTNHLDLETVEALVHALNAFEGGVLVVSHDEFFLSMLCNEMWVLDNNTVTVWEGDFADYKKRVLAGMSIGASGPSSGGMAPRK
eukprot:TRINITY_DN5664_c0_g1_i1.p1 TRINITY_DN5664_c0_g1~~TRINITY_DN5664_c0_g1_i1.p1  ORF type:complete len:740 (-),score=178.61 TRINITY_DN5664_c0_g1_i1:19-2148(-)